MALNFPSGPSVGQQYPSPAIAGLPIYRWTGSYWTTLGAAVGAQPIYADGTVPMTAQLTLVNADPVNNNDAARKSYVDARLRKAGGDVVTGGFRFTPYNVAAGSFQLDAFNHNYQWINNTSAFTITAMADDSAIDLLVINGAGAGAITFSGFTVGANVGDALTTTNGHKFIISFRRINGTATYVIKALQ